MELSRRTSFGKIFIIYGCNKNELGRVVDWIKVDKDDYLLAMERSPIKDIEIKHLLNNALTSKTDDREIYMKGIDTSYYYEGYTVYRAEELKKFD